MITPDISHTTIQAKDISTESTGIIAQWYKWTLETIAPLTNIIATYSGFRLLFPSQPPIASRKACEIIQFFYDSQEVTTNSDLCPLTNPTTFNFIAPYLSHSDLMNLRQVSPDVSCIVEHNEHFMSSSVALMLNNCPEQLRRSCILATNNPDFIYELEDWLPNGCLKSSSTLSIAKEKDE